MAHRFLSDISERNARMTMFLFFGLLILSVTFFVSADDTATNKNIFQDSDQDGLSNDEEALYKTDPLDKDSDDDGYTDGVEVESGYNPLKPAPGDRVVSQEVVTTDGTASQSAAGERVNLTKQVSNEIATMVQGSTTGDGEPITMETINESVQSILNQSDQEIVLPEVNIDDIKIKKISKKLKGDQRKEKEREDALEYLTVMSYILANNSPKSFRTENELSQIISSIGIESLAAMSSGNLNYLGELAKKGEKTLDEISTVEVPEGMLDVHVKAIKMAKYAMHLNDKSKAGESVNDPLGQIANLSKIQGFLGVVQSFSDEVIQRMDELGIKGIPIEF